VPSVLNGDRNGIQPLDAASIFRVGTTAFRSKLFQIPQASLPNSVAHSSKFSTYSN